MELKNKKILITGATGGIGNSLLEKFNSYGAKIVATGTNEEKLDRITKSFSNIIVKKFDLSEHSKIQEFIEKIFSELNGIDVLINNAGINRDNLSLRLSEEEWKKVIDVNLTSTFLTCKFLIKKMLKQKKGKLLILHQ